MHENKDNILYYKDDTNEWSKIHRNNN
jgi:hypothetical protein